MLAIAVASLWLSDFRVFKGGTCLKGLNDVFRSRPQLGGSNEFEGLLKRIRCFWRPRHPNHEDSRVVKGCKNQYQIINWFLKDDLDRWSWGRR